MKSLLVALCFVVAAQAAVSNPIDNLVKEALEYVRKMMKDHEPFTVGNIPTQEIKDNDPPVDLQATLTNLKVSHASDFTVDHIENNLIGLWAKFAVSEPTAHIEGDYVITGTAAGKAVNGKGTFTNDVTNVKVQGFFQLNVVDHSIHMEAMNLTYSVEGLKFSIEGLTVEGITQQQLEDLFNKQLLSFFQNNEVLVAEKISNFVMQEANKITKGKTLQELIQWLKNFIHS